MCRWRGGGGGGGGEGGRGRNWGGWLCYFSMSLMGVALHEVTWCMVVWCTQNTPRWQQFHVAPAMLAL